MKELREIKIFNFHSAIKSHFLKEIQVYIAVAGT